MSEDGRIKGSDGSEFPPFFFPTIFSDGIGSIANSHQFVKFYLVRNDPSFGGVGSSHLQPTAQIIMPMDAFLGAFVFLETSIRGLIKQGFVNEGRLEEIRKEQAQFFTTGNAVP